MSKSRSRNSLLSSSNRSSFGKSTKDELLAIKFSMEKPEIPLYPLNDIEALNETSSENPKTPHPTTSASADHSEITYPDYKPWKDHTNLPEDKQEQEHQKLNNASFLNKGYFESPMVANEYYSARNLIQATIFSSTENCNDVLKELSQHLANAYKTRNEIINKIKYESNNFKIPPRVTLTASKREAWLKDLANPNLSLPKIAEKIPHGIRNKILIDAVCNKGVPINRALWFTKCVLFGELVALRRKHQSRLSLHSPIANSMDLNTPEKFEIHWLQEWTQQVSDYIYKFARESASFNTGDRKSYYISKLNYLLSYVQSLYVEFLLDKSFFLALIIKFLKDGLLLDPQHVSELISSNRADSDEGLEDTWSEDIDLNYGQRLVALTLIKVFWKDILKYDYLCKELSETLLLNHLFISKINSYSFKQSHTQNHRASLPESLRQNILDMIGDTVIYLFKFNTNVFIIPNYWILVSGVLFRILLENDGMKLEAEQEEISKQLELIKYRNESLILNMRNVQPALSTKSSRASHGRRGSSIWNQSFVSPSSGAGAARTENFDNEHTFINRSSDDILKIICQLDSLKLNDELANLLKPVALSAPVTKGSVKWRVNLKVVLCWCITRHRISRESSGDILIVCNFLKRKVLQTLNTKSANNLRAEFENEILEVLYNIADSNSSSVVNYDLYVLINELYQLKVITIASYLRKLIASGIFYVSPDAEDNVLSDSDNSNILVRTHLQILQNLPVINNKQCDSILKKWTSTGFNFKQKFDMGQEILRRELIQKTLNNSFDDRFEIHIAYIKDLNVGLKFLLVNWLTNELKSTITESPKLIHINPTIISNLYNFYSICDNLTVFFKVLVKFILRNEGGMIIFYLESLYLIARLIIKHFKLVMFIAGNNYGSTSTAYELFKLIIQNYKDCSTREFDYFKFDQVWSYIDTAVERNYEQTSPKTAEGDARLSRKRNMTVLFDKDQIDSPMKINTENNTSGRSDERYTSIDFRKDLDALLESVFKPMESTEMQDTIKSLDLNIDVLDLSSVPKELKKLYDNELSEEDENLLVKLLINSQYLLNLEGPKTFESSVEEFIKEVVKVGDDEKKIGNFFKRLAFHEVIRINELFAFLEPLSLNHKDRVKNLVFDILLGNQEEERECFTSGQILMLGIMRRWFRKRSSSTFLIFILKGIRVEEGSIFDGIILEKYGNSIFTFLNQIIVSNTKVVSDEIISKINTEDGIRLLSTLFNIDSYTSIDSLAQLEKISDEIDEFNLPIFQLLLKVLSIKELSMLDENDVQERLRVLLETFLENLTFRFTPYNSFFGELFTYLPWEYNVVILGMLETKFLTMTNFQFDRWENDSSVVVLTNSSGTTNLLPVFNDYFKKFSSSSSSTVQSSSTFFQNLSKFLSKLLLIVNSENSLIHSFEDVSNTVSIFLRILIIHKQTLTKHIVTQDADQFTFIKNLISLINSKFISEGNEKLRILLYDLLLLMKSSVTEEINSHTENDLSEGTSPGFGINASNSPLGDELTKVLADPMRAGGESASFVPSSTVYTQVSSLFNLPEPNETNPFKKYIVDDRVECALTLTEDELQRGGDIHGFNDSDLVLISNRSESVSFSSAFGILPATHQKPKGQPFKMRSYEILEGTSSSLNDGCINLHLFDAYTTKENPQ
ncbi:subunit of activation mediator subcomplex of RNA polymerase II holoenzyme [Scheffersomyces xylosifermentans]|uniref:subunit of activation mediator subcomplex of RNA polymerase II holoenzyme n=1 Tax=Scheffersomyces xylosifermentans TaxID=1304137 RepID=UPI00315D8BBD